MTAAMAPAAPAISVRGVTKTFPGVLALKPVDLDVAAGSIHAFVGENGAGKSTLLKIIAGAQAPTAGSLFVHGHEVAHSSPRQARKLGVMAVYQELTIVPKQSAMENVFLGQMPSRGGIINAEPMRRSYAELCERMDVTIPAGVEAGSLSVADQQVLEIMRALKADASVLLLDEPTASLALHEREALGRVMRSLAGRGVTIIWISHDLDEVLELSDEVSVFREGSFIETRPASGWTKKALVMAMLGGKEHVVPFERSRAERPVAISVRNLIVPGVLNDISFDIREGEILGIAGIVGSGRTALLRALVGLDDDATGSLVMDGVTTPLPSSPRDAIRRGIALAPEDRKEQGLVLGLTTTENLAIPMWQKLRRNGVLMGRVTSEFARQVGDRVGLKPEYLDREVRALSGGNQQKVVLGKWSERGLRLFLVDEPTRGIDINAKAEIYKLLDSTTKTTHTSVLLVSSEFDELTEVCDRVLVLSGGQIVHELQAPDISEELILHSIFEVAQ